MIIGAGPAGLAAAYELVRQGRKPVVLEKSNQIGGLARTETQRGYYFDVGGHRFFTKIGSVARIWRQMAGGDFIKVTRMSRIYYRGRFFNYPLRFFNALLNLGIAESLLVVLSYVKSKLFPFQQEGTFEQWVSNRFGERLYRTFFKTYTEKVWGIPCSSIRADWAAQRIKGLSLIVAVANALFGSRRAKSLIEEFDYPLRGPGQMWQRFAEAIDAGGGRICVRSEVACIHHEEGRITGVTCSDDGKAVSVAVDQLISSMPVNRLISRFDPAPPEKVLEAARGLHYRAFIIVILIIGRKDLFPDQWIYIHNPEVRVGRIQNFKNWSAAMVPDATTTSIGMEYFCTEGDDLWTMPDEGLIAVASRELSLLGMAEEGDVVDSFVVRQADAYPVYDESYQKHLEVIRDYLDPIKNLQTIGRSGMHRYNNMDHSMYTGILAAENVLGARHNLWEVNEEEEYLEETREAFPEKVLVRAFARMDSLAFAAAVGSVSGLYLFLATLWLVIRGGPVVGPNLALLSEYFAGYTVTVKGAFIALGYSFFWGFLFGWLYSYLRNLLLAYYIYRAKKKVELLTMKDFLDHF